MVMATDNHLQILLAAPRGFCAGVDRAIQIVEKLLEKYGSPVYVRHEIVHNKFVVNGLRERGAIFIKSLDEIPSNHTDRPVVFSAHGVAKSVPEKAERLNLFYIDATCPLVSKVHRETERHYKNGNHIILIGHSGHPEIIGTMGQLPVGSVTLVETVEDVERLTFKADDALAFATQTTLSLDDTADIIAALKAKYPDISAPHKEDICYATTNRQEAVKMIAERVDAMLVIGAPNSSNSNRLVEVALNYGCPKARLVQRAAEIDWSWLDTVKTLGLTAGASAPEILVKEVITACEARFDKVSVQEVTLRDEDVEFKLPRMLRA
jgi:4-hydroxy-3-methylbut-2-enyl diphosphate reductase